MAISRRVFLKSGTLTALAAGVALSPRNMVQAQRANQGINLGYQIPITAQQQPTYMFKRSTFAPYVGGVFQAPDARGRLISLTLLSASTNKPSANTRLSTRPATATDSFSLMFKAAAPLPKFTSIHQVSHPALGKFDLFLTPHPQADGVMLYEAVFNHI